MSRADVWMPLYVGNYPSDMPCLGAVKQGAT